MESSGDHGRGGGLNKPPAGHSFSLGPAGCFPWPPPPLSSTTCYTCGYCRREFRSAQALGGHMNVHRRDRARLRQRCSAAAAAAAHNGPSSSLASPVVVGMMTTAHHQHAARAPPLLLPNLNLSPPPPHHRATDPVIYSFFSTSSAAAVATKAAALEVSLELGIGVCGSNHAGGGVEDDGLDLELRLG